MESSNLQSNQKLVTNSKEYNTLQNEIEPSPERFNQYVEINDDEGELIGFFIIEKNKKIIFYFDQFGGWYDEGRNYYDCNGDYIEIPPQNSEFKAPIIENLEDEEDENQEDSVEDFIIPKNNHYSSENGSEFSANSEDSQFWIQEEIENFKKLLNEYPENEHINIYFDNFDPYVTQEDIQEFFNQNQKFVLQQIQIEPKDEYDDQHENQNDNKNQEGDSKQQLKTEEQLKLESNQQQQNNIQKKLDQQLQIDNENQQKFQKQESQFEEIREHSGSGFIQLMNKEQAIKILELHEQPHEFQGYRNFIKLTVYPFEQKYKEEKQLYKINENLEDTKNESQQQVNVQQNQLTQEDIENLYNQLKISKRNHLLIKGIDLKNLDKFKENLLEKTQIKEKFVTFEIEKCDIENNDQSQLLVFSAQNKCLKKIHQYLQNDQDINIQLVEE